MSIRRALAGLLVTLAGAFVARPAVALAPCHDVWHLTQGTPLLLTAVRAP